VVSSIGDARSLAGGTLLMTPLMGPDQRPYALAQGAITAGGYVRWTSTAQVSGAEEDPILYVAMTPSTGEEPTPEFPWLWVLLLVAILVASVLLFLWRQRKPGGESSMGEGAKESPGDEDRDESSPDGDRVEEPDTLSEEAA